jgi:hypothetical protein
LHTGSVRYDARRRVAPPRVSAEKSTSVERDNVSVAILVEKKEID